MSRGTRFGGVSVVALWALTAFTTGCPKADPAHDDVQPPPAPAPTCPDAPVPGTPTTIAEDAGGSLAADASGVYWITRGPTFALRRRAPSGQVSTLVPPSAAELWRVALDSSYAYTLRGSTIVRIPKAGGAARVVTTAEDVLVGDLRVDETSVYWSGRDGIFRAPKSGGHSALVARSSERLASFTLDGGRLAWLGHSSGVGVDSVLSAPVVGGYAEPLVAADAYYGRIMAVGFDPTHVYWNEGRGLFRRPRDGGSGERLFDGRSGTEAVLKIDDRHVYEVIAAWTMKGGHPASIIRVPKAGGCPQNVITLPRTPSLALDGEHVYWTDAGGLRALAK